LSFRPRETALVIAIVSALSVWWAWAAIDPLPLVADEVSFVLQAEIFATGHWTAPTPPVPEFFQQPHVLTTPAVASKYPPGHALLLSVGALVGVAALVPLLLAGLSGALIFLLVRRIANEWVGFLTWIFWLSDPINLRFRAGYYSEVTSGTMWLLAWWSLLEWRETRRRRWLLAVAAAIGWGAITRPLTMLAFAIPVGVLVIRDVARARLWKDFALALLVGTCVLGVIPLWSARTTGSWRETPLARYTHEYLPFDKPGFAVDPTRPTQTLSPVNRDVYNDFYADHVRHTWRALPRMAFDRLRAIAHDEWSGVRIVLAPFVVLGLFALPAESLFVLACAAALFVGYLSYTHVPQWTVYYLEALPVLSLLAALGVWKALSSLRGLGGVTSDAKAWGPRWLRVAAAALLVALTGYELQTSRVEHRRHAAVYTAFQEMLDKLPMHAAVVFVHYGSGYPHADVVRNSARLNEEPVWIVNDLGARNAELMAAARPRIPVAFYESSGKVDVDRSLMSRLPPK
jgi:hypothetical protein